MNDQSAAASLRLASLAEQSRQGDKEAFGAIYDLTFDSVYRFALAMSRSRQDAEDITGETFERALRSIRRYRPQGVPITAWMIGIARNVACEYSRQRATTELDTSESQTATRAPTPEDTIVALDSVWRGMERLTPPQREVFAMRLAGFKVREIAVALGKAEGTVKAQQFAALQRLRETVRNDG